MDSDLQQQSRIPSLSYYCYKYINSHLDSIQSLGSLPFSLCEPILRNCSAEQLLTVEGNSPHLAGEDQDIWQILCRQEFPRFDRFLKTGQASLPNCWRTQFFACREEEERRFQEVGSRIRNLREEADQEKKERQVILTDKLPPAKRIRPTSKSKTLFEKARADSLKAQRLFHGSFGLPSMHSKPVKPRHTPLKAPQPSKSATPPLGKSSSPSNDKPVNSQQQVTLSFSPTSLPQLAGKTSGPAKKDPMAALFMPKHRAYSQRSAGPSNSAQHK